MLEELRDPEGLLDYLLEVIVEVWEWRPPLRSRKRNMNRLRKCLICTARFPLSKGRAQKTSIFEEVRSRSPFPRLVSNR
eukprot:UN23054